MLFQLVGRLATHETSFEHQPHSVAAFRFVEVSRGDYHRQAFLDELIQDGPEVAAGNWIHAVRGFVQEKHFRAMQQAAHQRQFLLHPSGKLAGLPPSEGFHAGHVEEFAHQRISLGVGNSKEIGVEEKILFNGQIQIHAKVLRHVTNAVFHCQQIVLNALSADLDFAFVRVEQSAQHAQRGRLACTVGTDQSEDLTFRYCEVQGIHCRERAKAASTVFDGDRRLSSHGKSSWSFPRRRESRIL